MAWKKGESGNPNGRPPAGMSLAEVMREMLERVADDESIPANKRHLRYKELLIEAIVRRAINGDPTAMKLVMAYTDGLPVQRIDVAGSARREDIPLDEDELALYRENLRRAFPMLAGPNSG